jgi:hypothetical protein
MTAHIPDLNEFLTLPLHAIYDIVSSQALTISLLLNGSRRWYIAKYFDAPPTDDSYFPHYLDTVLVQTGRLLTLLAEHGLYRVFLPVYSPPQENRHPQAYQVLLQGVDALTHHPSLLDAYQQSGYTVRFFGDMMGLPRDLLSTLRKPIQLDTDAPRHALHYGVNIRNPHNHLLQLTYQFGVVHGRAPSWADMVELYYGDRSVRPVNILIAFNRTYSREGIPPLLEGHDRIYTTVVTPLVLSQIALRRILYDYLYNNQDPSRNYTDIHPNEVQRLKHFYAANQEVVMGLMEKHEDLVYPAPTPIRSAEERDIE